MLDDVTNRRLVQRLKEDDMEAFDALYHKFHVAIYDNVFKITRDFTIAEDIVQEVFIALWEKRHKLDSKQGISGWLFVVSYNKSVDHLKRKLKESLLQTTLQQLLEDAIVEEDELVTSQINIFGKAIEKLSPQKKKVFELCKLQRTTYEEAAARLNLSKHTVKEYLSDSVIFIKEYIKQHPVV